MNIILEGSDSMQKIAFVPPWFGENIPGGAEMELRGLATHLHEANIDVEVITTCVKDFNSDWNLNYYKQGIEFVYDIPVRRFPVRKRNVRLFDQVNYKLMNQIEISKAEEKTYIEEMINSPEMYRYINENSNKYEAFIYIPYMFGTTYYGCKACPEKAILIPCFHDESYLYLDIYKDVFEHIKGIIYHAQPEYDLANRVFNFKNVKQAVLGEGVYTDVEGSETAFRKKYNINSPFIVYAGRKDKGKNVDTLVQYFNEYKKRNINELKLVLIGGGEIEIPKDIRSDVIDLGFVSMQEKYDAFTASLCLCQPSKNESFSLVIMESWLCSRPIIVHQDCNVTSYFAEQAKGGLYFKDYFEFEGCVNYLIDNVEKANSMGENGRKFVLENYSWEVITKKYLDFINS